MDEAEIERIADMVAKRVIERLAQQPAKQLVDRKELAEILSVSVSLVDRYKKEGKFPVVMAGSKPLFDPTKCRHVLEFGR